MSEGSDHLAEVNRRIAEAATSGGRRPEEVTLVAVSKTHGPERVRELLDAGQRIFGENRVQEAQAKYPALKTRHPDLRLHLIGPLQTNKVKEAVALFDVIETVDRPRLAETLAKEMTRQNRDVAHPIAQRRQRHRDHVQACQQLFTELSGGNCLLQIVVGRRDQPKPDLHFLRTAESHEGSGLQCTRELRLEFLAERSDLFDEQRSIRRQLNEPRLATTAGSRAALVAK